MIFWQIAIVPWVLLCYFMIFTNGADLNFRLLSDQDPSSGAIAFYRRYFTRGFALFLYDHFGLHCPWDWGRAKRFRLADLRRDLPEGGAAHMTLGFITPLDCDDPAKQEAIARHAFVSRGSFWTHVVINCFIVAPIFGSFIITGTLIGIMIDLLARERRS
jgi:hypothetical protein